MRAKRHRTFLGIVGLLVVGVLTAGYFTLGGPPKSVYKTAPAERTDIAATISATGNLNAVVTVQVGSQVSGTIKQLFADFNSVVKKNRLIARIDPDTFEAKLAQAKADLDSVRAAVLNQRAAVVKAEADVANARAAAEGAKANVVKAGVAVQDAQIKWRSRESLHREGGISQEERDSAKANYDSAVAQLEAARAQLEAAGAAVRSAEAQLNVARAQLEAAQATVAQKAAAVTQAQVDLDHTYIRAPVDGVVVSRNVDVGQTVAASLQAPTLFLIAQDLTKMQVDTNVDEADIGRVVLDQMATFTVDAYPGQFFRGRVVQIRQAPQVIQNVVTYDAVINVDNPDLKLRPGMTANVKILVTERKQALAVPNAAFRVRIDLSKPEEKGKAPAGAAPAPASARPPRAKTPDEVRQRIFVLIDGQPQERWIRTGITDGQKTEVLEGLRPGEQVIVALADRGGSSPAAPRGPALRF